MKVAYLVNQYPKISHSFIRREILELEKQGVEVERFALRGWDEDVVDSLDLEERNQTAYTLRKGAPV
ncbi:MAG: colanic acid biosynthesis glycosyltransferase WcaL, partial [Pseudomonadales bacterium]|nr:colanic acid biosynthesis glycosyltransferase WcaL [Pseudomonadales bacterium]